MTRTDLSNGLFFSYSPLVGRSKSDMCVSAMMTIIIRDPTWRAKLARRYRATRKAQRKRARERELHAAEHAAYQARQPELIQREEKHRGRGLPYPGARGAVVPSSPS